MLRKVVNFHVRIIFSFPSVFTFYNRNKIEFSFENKKIMTDKWHLTKRFYICVILILIIVIKLQISH